ncbi:MAG: prephenate dehydrogenase/arogenate dehydrogenase family protein, partial [Gaiellaceae bacterium]
MAPRRLALVGTGLIGASVGLAAKRAGATVSGWDPDTHALAVATERGAVDDPHDTLATALAGAELAIVAAPVAALARQVRDTLATSGEDCTVTDVGSTKAAVCDAAAGSSRFLGGHPIAGAELHGPEHATATLFDGATWYLCPLPDTDPARYRLVHGFVGELGATPFAIEPVAHDRLVGIVSHLPHVLANVLVNPAGGSRIDGNDPLAAAGASFRDMTRVAGANPRIWVDILLDNAEVVGGLLAEQRRELERVERALEAGDAGFLARWIGDAAGNRRRMLAQEYPDPGTLQRLRVHVSDRPGVLAGITQALGAERINIEDFELHHVSPERGGNLTVLVAGAEAAARAAA